MLAILSSVFTVEITTPRPNVECSSQNCVISFANMAEEHFDEMITSEQSGILALKFSSCQLYKIPDKVFEKLPTLLCLMVTSPGLTSLIEDSFLNASNLQFLYLPGNRLKKLGPQSFRGASNLNEINLTDNEIEVVSEEAFEGLEHLESLSLSRNQIAFFGQATFSPLTDLMNLDISGNMIEFLDARLFLNNKQLRGINIAENEIISITTGFLQMLPQIKVLNIMDNPCTNQTMLENIPLIKITDDQEGEDESSLDRCYQNYIEMTDPETGDMDDLLSQAEVVIDDIETNIISELTDELREKDVLIKKLEEHDDLIKILLALSFTIFFLFGVLKYIGTVESVRHKEIQEKIKDNVEVVTVDPKQIVYTIEV